MPDQRGSIHSLRQEQTKPVDGQRISFTRDFESRDYRFEGKAVANLMRENAKLKGVSLTRFAATLLARLQCAVRLDTSRHRRALDRVPICR
jgi:hypothetical protein